MSGAQVEKVSRAYEEDADQSKGEFARTVRNNQRSRHADQSDQSDGERCAQAMLYRAPADCDGGGDDRKNQTDLVDRGVGEKMPTHSKCGNDGHGEQAMQCTQTGKADTDLVEPSPQGRANRSIGVLVIHRCGVDM